MKDFNDSKTDELLTMLEDLQSENEALQEEISKAQQTTSQLSSENSVLKNELQKKSETIVTLNGQIGRLNESDLVLRQNEKLVKQNKELQQSAQRSREEAEATVSNVKREYAARTQELDQQIRQAAQQERAARDMESNYNDKVSEEAKRITEKSRAAAEQEYRTKAAKVESKYEAQRNAVYAVTMGSLLYGVFATLLTACNSDRFTADTAAFASGVWEMLTGPVWMALEACKAAWGVKDRIPYQGFDILAAGGLTMIVFLLITGLIYGLTGYVVYEAVKFYHAEFWDLVSGVVALVSMGILVWFADALSFVSWNLILVWLLIHGIYVLIRMKISAD